MLMKQGFSINLLPTSTCILSPEKEPRGIKQWKKRISVLLCCNSDGSGKLKFVVVGKLKNPRCFKLFLPVVYKNNLNSWMTTQLLS